MSGVLQGLTPQSQQIVEQYLQWERLAHEKLKRDIAVDASAFQTGNLAREQFSKDDVRTVLQGQLQVLLSTLDRDSEVHHAATAELVRAVLRDADKQRVILNVNAVETLSSTSGVIGMRDHIQQVIGGPRNRLAPIGATESGGEAGRQLAEANSEIHRLRDKLRQITDQYTQVMGSRSQDSEKVLLAQDEILRQHNERAQALSQQQEQQSTLEHRLQQARSELIAAKKELNTRLGQSTQYQQLKQLLKERNEQLRTLRAKLATYDPAYAQGVQVNDGDIPDEAD